MKHPVVVGLQYGDEGKGKITDLLAAQADWVIRFNGGNNAGHTLTINGKKVVTHSVPSGIMYSHARNYIGAGCVVDPVAILEEIEDIEAAGRKVDAACLRIDFRAQMILPIHKAIDKGREAGDQKLGSTLRGIGPCYMSKVDRVGFRFGDLRNVEASKKRLEFLCEVFNARLEKMGVPTSSVAENLEVILSAKYKFEAMLEESPVFFHEQFNSKKCLLEGAQGTLLDIDHGSFPFVTSSNTVAPYCVVGAPFPLAGLGRVLGVTKAYLTRVGEGPMDSEVDGSEAERLRQKGGEFGATTGRPRRMGWLNLDELKRAVLLNGCTDLVITKSDILDGEKKIKVMIDGAFEEMDGWPSMLSDSNLHPNLMRLVELVQQKSGASVLAMGTGPGRDDIFWLGSKDTLWG